MPSGPSDTLIAHKAISLSDDLTGTEKRVAATIIDHFNRKSGRCDPALGSIARLLGVNRRTVIRAVGSLVLKGYIRKTRHGGHYHRNSYEPIWSRFRGNAARWTERRMVASRRVVTTDVSPSERLACHLDGDADVTQTCSSNSYNKTLVATEPATQTRTSNRVATSEGLSKEGNRKAAYSVVEPRFHVKSTSSQVAARDAAERRWNELLTKKFVIAPDVFASLVDAIDMDLRVATTDAELRKPGSGIGFLLKELDRRSPLALDAQTASFNKSTVPSGDVGASSNSDRDGSPVSATFQSLNITKHQA